MKNILLLLTYLLQICIATNSNAAELSPSEKTLFYKVVKEWSDAHNDWDLDKLKNLYASDVLFYGQQLKKDACISKVSSLLKPNEIFYQSIASDVAYNQFSNGVIQASFTKKVKTKNKTNNYPSYLLLIRYNDTYLIVGESDEITDRNLKFKLDPNSIILPTASIKASGINPSKPESSFMDYLFVFLFAGVVIGLLVLYFVMDKRKSAKAIKREVQVNDEIKKTDIEVVELDVVNIPSKEEITKSGSEIVAPLSNEEKGYLFEKYIVKKFKTNYFKQLAWRGDKYIDGHYPKESHDPDLEYNFVFKDYSRIFAVECKFRSNLFNGKIEIEDRKFKNYIAYSKNKNIPVYIALGIGGVPDAPQDLYLIPLSELESHILNLEVLNKYCKSKNIDFYYKQEIEKLT